jgi:AcrR family transcriptional regulator
VNPAETRSARKRRAILPAATVVFLREGYARTTMGQVAALAEVSKPTIYRNFVDKSTLFTEVVTSTVDHASNVVQQEILALGRTGDLEAGLRAGPPPAGRRDAAAPAAAAPARHRRTGAAPRARKGLLRPRPGRTIGTLALIFDKLTADGMLRAEDPHPAATQFNWLVMAEPLNRAMLLGVEETPATAEHHRYADHAARTFLAAYRP